MSVQFEPAPVARPGRRRTLPVTLAAVLVTGLIAVAIVKPWSEPQGLAIAPGPSGGPAVSDQPATTEPVARGRPLDWAAIGPLLHTHGAWGIRTIVERQGALGEFDEEWQGSEDAAAVPSVGGAGRVLALGLTGPDGMTPIDLRVWQIPASGPMARVAAIPPPGSGPVGSALLVPAGAWAVGGTPAAWPAGRYRVDALLATGIRRQIFEILADGVASSGPTSRPAAGAVVPRLAPPTSGAFVVPSSGDVIPIPAMPGPALSERESWLALPVPEASALGPQVGVAVVPDPIALGVVVDGGRSVASAELSQLAPVAQPLRIAPIIEPEGPGGNTIVVFGESARGGAWPGRLPDRRVLGWRRCLPAVVVAPGPAPGGSLARAAASSRRPAPLEWPFAWEWLHRRRPISCGRHGQRRAARHAPGPGGGARRSDHARA